MKRTIINPIFKDSATFLQTAEETGGKLTEGELTLQAGGSNPLHYHKRFAETFTAVRGDLGLRLGKHKTKILKEGESYTVEPLSLHSFFNPTDQEIIFNIKVRPGSVGFENSLRILYGLAADGLTNNKSIPKSIKHSAIIICMGDTNLPGLFTILFPLLKRIADKAKANGEEQRLIDKYCT